MNLYDYFSWRTPSRRSQPLLAGNLLARDNSRRNLKNLYQQRNFRESLVRSRSQKEHQLNSELLGAREHNDYGRKSLMEKLDRKLESIRSRNLNGSQLKKSSASLHRDRDYGLFAQASSPKRYLVSEPTPKEHRLGFGQDRVRLKQEIAKSIGRLSRVSRKLYEQRRDDMHHLKRGRDEYFTRATKPQYGREQRIEKKAFLGDKHVSLLLSQSRFGGERDKYNRILKNQQLLEDQLRGFGSYGLHSRSRQRL